MPLWGMGGYLLGAVTALMGSNAIMICTAAVEKAVHRHMEEQIVYLASLPHRLHPVILAIQAEELEHLQYAEAHATDSLLRRPLHFIIETATDIVIWLSTQGEVTKWYAKCIWRLLETRIELRAGRNCPLVFVTSVKEADRTQRNRCF